MSGRDPPLRVAVLTGAAMVPEPGLEDLLAGLLDFAYRREAGRPASLDLLLAGDSEMAGLNRRHLGVDSPTDVIAFEDGEEDGEGRLRLGDIAVGLETARRTAAQRGGDPGLEAAFYALHGLLHLLGRRDGGAAERAAMLGEQARLMREYGIEAAAELL